MDNQIIWFQVRYLIKCHLHQTRIDFNDSFAEVLKTLGILCAICNYGII